MFLLLSKRNSSRKLHCFKLIRVRELGERIQGKNSGVVSNNSNRNYPNLKYAASGHLQNGSKMKEIQALPNVFTSNDQTREPHQNPRKFDDFDHKKKMETLASGHVGNWSEIMELGVSQDGYA